MPLGSDKENDQLDATRLELWTFPSSFKLGYKFSKKQVYIMKSSIAKKLV